MTHAVSARWLRRTTFRQISATCFLSVFLVWQVALPLYQLTLPRPSRWGWQMYSGTRAMPTFWLIQPDGSSTLVDPRPYIPAMRNEIQFEAFVPQHFCRIFPAIRAVRFQLPGRAGEEYVCR